MNKLNTSDSVVEPETSSEETTSTSKPANHTQDHQASQSSQASATDLSLYSEELDRGLNTPAVVSSVLVTEEFVDNPSFTEADQSQANASASTSTDQASASATTTDSVTATTTNTAKPAIHPLDYETNFQTQIQTQLPRTSVLLIILVALMSISSMGSNAFIPALKEMAMDFHASYGDIQSFIALYLLGSGVGQFVWGPVADSFGRRKTLLVCVVLGVITNLMFALSTNYTIAIVSRLLQGFSLTGLGMLATVTLRDSFSPRKFMTYSNMLVTVFMFVPAFSPFFGGYVYILLNWHAIFYILVVMAILATVVFLYLVPETLDPKQKQPFNFLVVAKNYFSIITNPVSLLLITINVLMSIATFSLPTLLPGILIGYYDIAPQHVGYFPLVFVIFVIIGLQFNQYFLQRRVNPLKLVFYGSILQFISLAGNVVVALGLWNIPLNLYTIMIPLTANIIFNGLQIGNLFAFYLMNYGRIIGTATSLLTCLRLLVPGIVLVWLAHIDAHHGASLLIFNAVLYLFSFIGIMIYSLYIKITRNTAFK